MTTLVARQRPARKTAAPEPDLEPPFLRVHFRVDRPDRLYVYAGDTELGAIVVNTRDPRRLKDGVQVLDNSLRAARRPPVTALELEIRHAANLTARWQPGAGVKGYLARHHLTGLHVTDTPASAGQQVRGALGGRLFPKDEFEIWPARLTPPRVKPPEVEPDEPPPPPPSPRHADAAPRAQHPRQAEEPEAQHGDEESLVDEVATTVADVATDFIPGISNVKDFTTFLTGRNPITGEKVGWFGRILALIFAIPGLGNLLEWIGKGARRLLGRLLPRVASLLRRGGAWLEKWLVAGGEWLGGKIAKGAGRAKEFLHAARERTGRLLEKLGLRKAVIGHAVPWSQMSKAERRAFQHSYSRHAHEFGLPKWAEGKAESLREQFNAAAGHVRSSAQEVRLAYKPVDGVTTPVRMFNYTDKAGTRWYYFETLGGEFVSAGLER